MSEQQEKFETWAVVELFGHSKIAGRVTEASIGGASFIRVDVPAQEAHTDEWGSPRAALPAFTRYFGPGAIYALNPCSEAVALLAAKQYRTQPPFVYDIPEFDHPALAAPRDPYHDDFPAGDDDVLSDAGHGR